MNRIKIVFIGILFLAVAFGLILVVPEDGWVIITAFVIMGIVCVVGGIRGEKEEPNGTNR